MAKDSQRDSSSDDEPELDNVADGTDDLAAEEEDVALDADDLDDEPGDDDDVDLDEDDEDEALDDEVAAEAAATGSTRRTRKAAAASAKKKKDTPTAKREAKPTTRSSIPGAAPGSFLQQVGNELSKVVWPTRKQMITYTTVVLIFVVALVAAVWGFDLGVGKLMDWIFA